jgi:protein-tyrosine phosphatase
MERDPLHLRDAHVVSMEGIENFRDIGGYATRDGRKLRWGKVFRCGHLMDMTPADGACLDPLQIGAIFDLRTPAERQTFPTAWTCVRQPRLFTIDLHPLDSDPKADLFQQILDGRISRDEVEAHMRDDYARMPFEFAPLLRQLFDYLLQPDAGSVVIHCTAGKDRTGLVIALLQAVLGMPTELICEDYLLSNEGFASREKLEHIVESFGHKVEHIDARMEVLQPLIVVDTFYLQTALNAIETEVGSLQAYFEHTLALTSEQQQALRDKLLQPA